VHDVLDGVAQLGHPEVEPRRRRVHEERTAWVGSANAVALIPSGAATANNIRVTNLLAPAWESLPQSMPTSAPWGTNLRPAGNVLDELATRS
jgi:hypothetical protein